jgi:hypothetical protein
MLKLVFLRVTDGARVEDAPHLSLNQRMGEVVRPEIVRGFGAIAKDARIEIGIAGGHAVLPLQRRIAARRWRRGGLRWSDGAAGGLRRKAGGDSDWSNGGWRGDRGRHALGSGRIL